MLKGVQCVPAMITDAKKVVRPMREYRKKQRPNQLQLITIQLDIIEPYCTGVGIKLSPSIIRTYARGKFFMLHKKDGFAVATKDLVARLKGLGAVGADAPDWSQPANIVCDCFATCIFNELSAESDNAEVEKEDWRAQKLTMVDEAAAFVQACCEFSESAACDEGKRTFSSWHTIARAAAEDLAVTPRALQ